MDMSRGKYLPGTTETQISEGDMGFSKIEALLGTMGGISLSQVSAVTGLEGSTIQNWVKRGWVENPVGKKYEERHLARILILNALKECFKLEEITLLMSYVNNHPEESGIVNITESELYNFLYQALQMLGQVEDLSRSGVEAIVDKVMKHYKSPTIDAQMRIRKALTVMIYACVCTDVKRGTEAMMKQVLSELDDAANIDIKKAKTPMPTKDVGEAVPPPRLPTPEKAPPTPTKRPGSAYVFPVVSAPKPAPATTPAQKKPASATTPSSRPAPVTTPVVAPMFAPATSPVVVPKPAPLTASVPATKPAPVTTSAPAPKHAQTTVTASTAQPKPDPPKTPEPPPQPVQEPPAAPRKTIAQAIREWEFISSADNRESKPKPQEEKPTEENNEKSAKSFMDMIGMKPQFP